MFSIKIIVVIFFSSAIGRNVGFGWLPFRPALGLNWRDGRPKLGPQATVHADLYRTWGTELAKARNDPP